MPDTTPNPATRPSKGPVFAPARTSEPVEAPAPPRETQFFTPEEVEASNTDVHEIIYEGGPQAATGADQGGPSTGDKPARPRQIDYVPLEDLRGDPRNPKSHDLSTIDSSYDRFGVVDLITVDGRTGYIASGHGRTTALKDAFARGAQPPEGVVVTDEGQWLIPVNSGWASKNDAEAAAALIAMNRVTEMGGWVDESLLELLQEISESGAGFEGVGFSETDLDDLKHLLEDAPDLDGLAEEWDPESVPNSGASSSVAVKLTDAGVVSAWHDLRDQHKSDDEAMRVLLGMDPVVKEKKARKPRSRAKDATVADLAAEDETPIDVEPTSLDIPEAHPLEGALTETAETAVPAPVVNTVENAVESALAQGEPIRIQGAMHGDLAALGESRPLGYVSTHVALDPEQVATLPDDALVDHTALPEVEPQAPVADDGLDWSTAETVAPESDHISIEEYLGLPEAAATEDPFVAELVVAMTTPLPGYEDEEPSLDLDLEDLDLETGETAAR